MKVIGLFFPAFISVWIKHLRNQELTWESFRTLTEYGIYALINVFVTVAIIIYGLNLSDVMADAFDSFPFFLKYSVIAMIVAILTPYIEEILKKYIKVTFIVRTKHEDKEDDTKDN